MDNVFPRAYGLDEIALAPSHVTIDPELVDVSMTIAGIKLGFPIIGSAMDSVVSPKTASILGESGGLGILNLEGIQTRYENPDAVLDEIAAIPKSQYVELMQKIYAEHPIQDELVVKRIRDITQSGAPTVVSATPQMASRLGPIAADAGADAFLVQSTVVSTVFKSKTPDRVLDLPAFCRSMKIPVMVGNTASHDVTLELLKTGVQAVFVGVGPGAACTTRGVLGIGVPMATSIADAASARNQFYQETGTYIPIVADGGIVNSGDICKAIACGADAVMIGSPLAKAKEAPGRGFHWGMATPNALLPRGARIEVGNVGSLRQILFGPSETDDGTQNLVGAITTCMATLGAQTIRDMHHVTIMVAPSLLTEGKVYQKAQALGMYKKA